MFVGASYRRLVVVPDRRCQDFGANCSDATRTYQTLRHIVSVDLVVSPVHHPHGGPVGPDAPRVIVAGVGQGVEVLAGVPGLAGQAVGVDLVVIPVRHPHGGPLGPDAPRVIVAGAGQGVEVLAGVPGLAGQAVGVDLVVKRVHHPHGGPVGPDAPSERSLPAAVRVSKSLLASRALLARP